MCPFGAKCYRKNLIHFAEFYHPIEYDKPAQDSRTGKTALNDSLALLLSVLLVLNVTFLFNTVALADSSKKSLFGVEANIKAGPPADTFINDKQGADKSSTEAGDSSIVNSKKPSGPTLSQNAAFLTSVTQQQA